MIKYYNIKAVDQSNNKKSIYNIYYNYMIEGSKGQNRSCLYDKTFVSVTIINWIIIF